MNEILALHDDEALNHALWAEIQRGTMLTSYESVVIEPTGRTSGRCVEFRMPQHGDAGDLWWAGSQRYPPAAGRGEAVKSRQF
jgi:hypothetical protein